MSNDDSLEKLLAQLQRSLGVLGRYEREARKSQRTARTYESKLRAAGREKAYRCAREELKKLL